MAPASDAPPGPPTPLFLTAYSPGALKKYKKQFIVLPKLAVLNVVVAGTATPGLVGESTGSPLAIADGTAACHVPPGGL